MTLLYKKGHLILVPAGAVIREAQVLSDMIKGVKCVKAE
jgi:hypothetical protein